MVRVSELRVYELVKIELNEFWGTFECAPLITKSLLLRTSQNQPDETKLLKVIGQRLRNAGPAPP